MLNNKKLAFIISLLLNFILYKYDYVIWPRTILAQIGSTPSHQISI